MKLSWTICNLALAIIFACTACDNNNARQENVAQASTANSDNTNNETLSNINKMLSEKDKDRIESFLKRNKLKANFNDGGYWISTITKGEKQQIKEGENVKLIGTVQLLDGTLCYTYTEDKPFVFTVGKTPNIISGLHNSLQKIHNKERAVLIFPPHLAFGILGDNDKVPPRSILVYDITAEIINN